ncbi:hypothetical protein BDF21DRAFT_485466 [Thamnidium elegans]|nr:hypothetical protein BDF21DRAFT_485466 [Thamnidium elegans]
MFHISYFIQQLGPLKAYSARSLERIIGLCKEKIKSRSKPGENAINFLRGNSVQSQQKWYTYKESNEDDFKEHSKITSDLLNDTLDPDGLPFNVMLRDFCSSNRLMFDCEETMFIREEYILSRNNQILKKTRGKDETDVVVQRNSESGSVKYSLVNIQAMFDYKNTNLVLVKDGCSLELDQRKRLFIKLSVTAAVDIWEIIYLKRVMGYAIKIPSLISEDKLYICFKK